MSDTVVRPVDDAVWGDLETVFSTPGDPSGCWCQWFKVPRAQNDRISVDERRELLHEQVRSGSPGVIAWIDGQPVGWAAVEPYSAYPTLARSPITRRRDDDPADPWAVTCFVVRSEFRRQGVARALLDGAVAHARTQGAEVVEGYPVDPEVRPSLSTAERYHGTVALFRDGGFEVVRRPSATRAIMRRTV
ncbi:GNAT family N-acetyltransferase [Leifsonia sp. 21MFCrub1.1]|uniref:GNAT family N-acetyltransferase n=1 Tax=Leifsonia sp. 21MFCrub1.1 TaxID=1798223 RepID=UPI0008929105|nr:GNAT family N-acetyltransferase [Leifsonia sp. 21MFCrub1.1]SEA78292.1 Acetyltransferase (GNAT) family protein [Leifsonia sp. 21MFCrub1.1]